MGETYTRQSSSTIVDGATIEASHFNAEFDQLLAAFQASTGHTHDGTANEGGPITKLLGNTLTFGAGTAGTDITITFDGETSDGVLKWMEDEDYFEFSDDILVASTEKLQFRDTAIYINSSTDGQLDLVADTEIQIAATTVDINGNVDVSGTLTVAGAVDFGDAALSNVGAVQLDSIAGDGDTDTSITFSGSDVITVTAGGDAQFTFNNGSIVPSTDNDIDLGTSSLEFKDAFFDGTVTTDALVADTANIDGGSVDGATLGTNSAITQAVIDNINIDGSTIGHTSDTDLLTLASGIVTVAGEVSMTTLDIGGTNVTSTAAELNLLDGITAGTVSASLAVIADSNKDISGFRNVTLTGELDAGSLDISGDADIDGTLEADAITVNGATLTEFITDAVGGMVSSNTETGISVTFEDGDNTLDFALGSSQTTISSLLNTSLVIGRDSDNDIDFATDNTILFRADGADQIKLTNGALVPVTDDDVDLGSSSLQFKDGFFDGTLEADAITVGGTAVLTGGAETAITSVLNTSLVVGRDADNDIDFATDNEITFRAGAEDQVVLKDGVLEPVTDDNIDLGSSSKQFKDVFIDGTLEADAITLNGTALGSTFQVLAGSSDTVTTGALNSGSITTGFGNIDNGASNITSGGLVKLDVDSDADDITGDSSTGRLTLGAGEDLNLYHGGTNSYIVNDTGNLVVDTGTSDADIVFSGNDGGSAITALTIDMSDAGKLLPNNGIDLNGKELILDADADTSITSDTDDQIDIRIAGADDFQFTANTFTIAAGSTIVNNGTMSPDISSTGKAAVFGF